MNLERKLIRSIETILGFAIIFGIGCSGLQIALAQSNLMLKIGFSGQASFLCDSTDTLPVLYVGSVCDIEVTLIDPSSAPSQYTYQGVTNWEWPENLVLKAGQAESDTGTIFYSSDLTNNLHLNYYVDAVQAFDDSVWQYTGRVPPIPFQSNRFRFEFEVPRQLANQLLCITAEWNHPSEGYIGAIEPAMIRILNPCSEDALHDMWATHVYQSHRQQQYEVSIALADSFLLMGWHHPNGLTWARMDAERTGNYVAAIRYLDICFDMNHAVEFVPGRKTLSGPTEASIHRYRTLRAKLIELRDQQQQR